MSDIEADAAWTALNKLIDPDCRNGKHRACVGGLCECSCHWTSKEATDDLATLLAAEEHRQGAPYLADPDHCERCAEVDEAWVEATRRLVYRNPMIDAALIRRICRHRDRVEIRTLDQLDYDSLCTYCGDTVHVTVRGSADDRP